MWTSAPRHAQWSLFRRVKCSIPYARSYCRMVFVAERDPVALGRPCRSQITQERLVPRQRLGVDRLRELPV